MIDWVVLYRLRRTQYIRPTPLLLLLVNILDEVFVVAVAVLEGAEERVGRRAWGREEAEQGVRRGVVLLHPGGLERGDAAQQLAGREGGHPRLGRRGTHRAASEADPARVELRPSRPLALDRLARR